MQNKIALYLLATLLLTLTPSNSTLAQSEKKTAYGVLLDNTFFRKAVPTGVDARQRSHKTHQPARPRLVIQFHTESGRGDYFRCKIQTTFMREVTWTRAVATLGLEWRQDENVLGQYIDSLLVVRGHTDLFGAIHLMTEVLNAKIDAEKDAFREKVIILITDGEHRMEGMFGSPDNEEYERKKQEKQLIKELKESGIRVYAVGLTRELDTTSSINSMGISTRERAETFLRKITKETGGRVIFPNPKKMEINIVLNELLAQ